MGFFVLFGLFIFLIIVMRTPSLRKKFELFKYSIKHFFVNKVLKIFKRD